MSNYNTLGRLDRVTKTFGEVVAVSDASFSIVRGDILGFLGPNGAGKTTSIEMLLGLTKPNEDAGHVELFGVDPFTNAKVKNLIGYISEEGVFPRWFTARKFLTAMARFNMDRTEAEERVMEVLKEVDLVYAADKSIRSFSKGMKQRIKIAQALLNKPALVIADEPFNGLDPVIRRNMFDLMRFYNKEYGTTFFVSSHILFEVEKLADSIILMYKGRTIAQGAPNRIREMIQDQPHSIQITTPEITKLGGHLVGYADGEVVSALSFEDDPRSEATSVIVETKNPKHFYQLLTDLVVEHSLMIQEVRPTDEGLETLFQSLTVG